MKALRMTRSETDRRPARLAGQGLAVSLVAVLGIGSLLLGVFGCNRDSRELGEGEGVAVDPPSQVSERPQLVNLPAPRPEWIEYSAKDRKLTFYQLRSSGRWMLKRSDREKAYPVGAEHVLPDGLNAAETFVYYTRPGGQTSRVVSLAQIQSSTREHVSINR